MLQSPRLYATFLLWLLSELYETLPEIGDVEKPKVVFFFDEAHLLFQQAPKVLLERIELVVRLARSKGVGVFFITQTPLDIPQSVLGQLGNRVQHALRAYTPKDQKAVRTAAQTMRSHPGLDIEQAISELATGEALVSFLDEKGQPSVTERVYVRPPASYIGTIEATQRKALLDKSLVAGIYEKTIDRSSAYEQLKQRVEPLSKDALKQSDAYTEQSAKIFKENGMDSSNKDTEDGWKNQLNDLIFGHTGPRGGKHDGLIQTMAKSAARTVGTKVGNEILRGVLGGIFGRRR